MRTSRNRWRWQVLSSPRKSRTVSEEPALLTTLGPLLGLLGTVVGIVVVFNRLAVSGGVATAQ